jgi:hypothetical protein
MLKQDYLLRIIRRAGEALARALGLHDQNKDEEARREAEDALRRLAKLPLDAIVDLDLGTVRPLLADGTAEGLRLTARGLWLLGEIDARAGRDAAARKKQVRAMQLYKDAGLGDDPLDARAAGALAARYASKR